MRSMTPPTVLLDRGFLEALADDAHPDAELAASTYRRLLEQSRRNERRLRARADHVADVAPDRSIRSGLLAPIEAIPVVGQHRRAAGRLDLPVDVTADVAVTLVIMRRERITEIATFDAALRRFDVCALP